MFILNVNSSEIILSFLPKRNASSYKMYKINKLCNLVRYVILLKLRFKYIYFSIYCVRTTDYKLTIHLVCDNTDN